MNDTQLANAAAVHFGGRDRAVHALSCDECWTEDGRLEPCHHHPARRRALAVAKEPTCR